MSNIVNARHLEIFLSLMTSPSLADAAHKLSISQPAVSKTVSFLEKETEVSLFVRTNGRLQPTIEAKQLMPYAQRTLGELRAARRIAYSLREGATQRVVVATAAPALISLLPVAMRHFAARHPNVKVEIKSESSANVAALVSSHEVDIGISATPVETVDARFLQRCRGKRLCEHELVAIVPKKHSLAQKAMVRPADLREQQIIALPEGSPTMVLLNAAFQEADVPIQYSVIASNSIGVCALVREGLGVGLINPMQLSSSAFPDIIAKPFRPKIILRTFAYFSSYQPLSRQAAQLVKFIEQAAKKQFGNDPG